MMILQMRWRVVSQVNKDSKRRTMMMMMEMMVTRRIWTTTTSQKERRRVKTPLSFGKNKTRCR